MSAKDPGDDSVILRVHAKWLASYDEVMQSMSNAAHILRKPDGSWQLALLVRRPNERQLQNLLVSPDVAREGRWQLVKLGPGTWDLPQAVSVEGKLHAFVTLCGVPNPAPWETCS